MTREDIIYGIIDLLREEKDKIWKFGNTWNERTDFLLWYDGEITCDQFFRNNFSADVRNGYALKIYSIDHIDLYDVFGEEEIWDQILSESGEDAEKCAICARVLGKIIDLDHDSAVALFGEESVYQTEELLADCEREEYIRNIYQELSADDRFFNPEEMDKINNFLQGGEE